MPRMTVSDLTRDITRVLGDRYPNVEVEGEITQVSRPASGHVYLTLAEGGAVLGGVVWRNTWQGMSWTPQRGDHVVCRGKIGVYPGKGAYQLYVNVISKAGEGALAAEIAARRARLEAEGLLDARRKRKLPGMPRFVGVATSLTGAALQDFLKVSRERFPAARILVAGCVVQGDKAPASVVAAVELLLADGRSDVVVVTRGGGSKEDLLAFQDEDLARFLAHCPVPVVSAVGHQVDTTLCDLVADAVAPTPTGAAVLCLPDAGALAQRVDEADRAMRLALSAALRRRRVAVEGLRRRLRHPGQHLREVRRRAVELDERLRNLLARRLRLGRARLDATAPRLGELVARRLRVGRARLDAATPRLHRQAALLVPARRQAVRHLDERAAALVASRLQRARARVERAEAALRALSPLAVLERGFAVVRGPTGVLHRAADAVPGDRLDVRLARGRLVAVVDAVTSTGEDGA